MMYQYVLDTVCTSMYLVFQIQQIRGQNLALAGPCGAQPYSCCPCSGQCCDYLWLCGMGVSAVQGCDECKMLSLQLTIEETAEKQDAASKSSDKLRKETCEGCKGDCAWLEWSVNCSVQFLMSMYLYILSTYWYVLVCTKCSWKVERRHTGALDCGKWGWVCWMSIWCYTSKQTWMLPDYLELYM